MIQKLQKNEDKLTNKKKKKFITTSKFNKLLKENFPETLKQGILVRKNDSYI